MLCLNVRQQFGRLEINSELPKLNLSKNGSPVRVKITTSAASLDIGRQKGGLDIDNTPCRYSVGMKNNSDYARDSAQEGIQALKNFAVKIVEYGNRLVSGKGNPETIANIARDNMVKPMPEIKVDRIAAPNISYTPDRINITYQPKKVNSEVNPVTIENNMQRATVDISLAVSPSIDMWVTEGKFDTSI